MDFKELVSSVRIARKMTKEAFAGGLNEYLPADETLSAMAVGYWEQGRYRPWGTRLYWIAEHAPVGSWQREFALRGLELRGLGTCNTASVATTSILRTYVP